MFLKVLFTINMAGLFFLAGMAQSDSFETKNVLLKEIIIQNDRSGNSREQKQPKNLQTGTDQILESIPGVTMIRRGNFALEPTVRGLNAGQINMTIDGMAMFGACTDRMDPVSSYIEPNNLQNITVSFGPGEGSAGNAIGGGFNFKIKQPKINAQKKWSGMAGTGYGSNGNTFQTLASVNYSTPKFGLLLNGIVRSSGNYHAGKREEIHFSQYRKWNGGIGLKYQLGAHSYLQANYIQDEGYDIGYPALLMDVAFAKAKIGSLTHFQHFANGPMQQVETKVYLNTVNHAMDDTKRPAEQVSMRMDMPGTSRTAGFYSLARLSFRNHEIEAKISGYQNRLHAEMTMYPQNAAPMYMLTVPDAERNLAALNFSDRVSLSEKFYLVAGGGADLVHSSLFTEEGKRTLSGLASGSAESTRFLWNVFLNPVFSVTKSVSVYANTAFAMRSGSLQEFYGFYLFNRLDGFDYLGNAGLKTENSVNISAGSTVRKDKFKLGMQVYGYFIQNYITGLAKPGYSVMTQGANGVKQYGNVAGAFLSGFELSAEVRLLPGLVISSANTYSYGRDAEKNALPMIPPLKSVNQLTYKNDKFSCNAFAVLSAKQNHISTAKYGESATPASAVINIDATHDLTLNMRKISFQAGIQNLFDTDYYEHLDVMKIPRMGRNIFGRVTVYF